MKIAHIRKQKGLTQAELAARSGSSQQQIAKLEKGQVDPRLSTLRRIAKALGCEVHYLLWSKVEFLREVLKVIEQHKMSIQQLDFLRLNSLCAHEKGIFTFHPYWEELEIRNNKLVLKEFANE